MYLLVLAGAGVAIPANVYRVVDEPGIDRAIGADTGAPIVFYLNKNGVTVRPGNDDSRTNSSSIIDQTYSVPAWSVSAADWATVKNCVANEFAPFNVTVTDVDPGNTPHYEIVVGGQATDIGMDASYGGVSPFTNDCSVIPNSVVYVFAAVYGSDYQGVCETAAQEVSHSFGLDHEHLCQDPMTYLSGCGDKSFQDTAAACGEYSDRTCYCGGSTQNSVQMLTSRIGPHPAGVDTPPTVQITNPGDGATVAPDFAVSASASDDHGVASVAFAVDGATVTTVTSAPYGFTCSAGDGAHTITATATDSAGQTGSYTIHVTVSSSEPPDPDAGVPSGGDDAPASNGDDTGGNGAYLTGGCSTGGGGGGFLAVLLLGLVVRSRRCGG